MSVAYGKGDKGKATKLHSSIIRTLGTCEKCDYKCPCVDEWKHTKDCKLQAAHIQGRTKSATRTLLINAFCLCASCHRIFTDKPLSFSRWITETWAQEYRDLLIQLSNTMTKMDWAERLTQLKAIELQIKSGLSLEEARVLDTENI